MALAVEQQVRIGFNTELAGRAIGRLLRDRSQRAWLAFGLLLPLAACLWTLLRPFNPVLVRSQLEQAGIWLGGFHCAFAIFYVLAGWARRWRGGEPLALLVSPLQTLVHRAIQLGFVPLLCSLLTLPLWLVLALNAGLPYGTQLHEEDVWWWVSGPFTGFWPARLLGAALVILSATLLPLGFALLLQETVRPAWLRSLLLLLPVLGLYALLRLYDYPLRFPYQQTRGYGAPGFLLPIVLLLLYALLAGFMRPGWRIALAALLALGVAALAWLPTMDSASASFRSAVPPLADMPWCGRYLLLHSSPPRNLRLVMESWCSNVLLSSGSGGGEPVSPDYPDLSTEYSELEGRGLGPESPDWLALNARRDKLMLDYNAASARYSAEYDAWEKRMAAAPRLPMVFGACILPLLLPLLATSGLLLAAARQPGCARDELLF